MLMITHELRMTDVPERGIYMLVGFDDEWGKGIGVLYITRKLANFKSHFPYKKRDLTPQIQSQYNTTGFIFKAGMLW